MRATSGATPTADITDRIARLLGVTRDQAVRALISSKHFSVGTSLGAGGAVFNEVQLFNPAASVITIVVMRVRYSSSLADTVELTEQAAAQGALFSNGVNDVFGGAAGAGQVRKNQPAVKQNFTIHVTHPALVNTVYDWPPDGNGAFVLPAGRGVEVQSNVQNVVTGATFAWLEVDPVTFL